MHFDFKARSRGRRTVVALVGGGGERRRRRRCPAVPRCHRSATARKAAPVLQAINVPKYPGVLGNSKSRSLYLLAEEAGGRLHCTGQCLQFWFPVYVKKGSHPSMSAGVKGKIGMVARKLSNTVTKYQVTDNGYPLYVFAGDTGPKQSNGQHVKFATGVYWYLVSASAKTAAKTPVKKATVTGSMLQDINVASTQGCWATRNSSPSTSSATRPAESSTASAVAWVSVPAVRGEGQPRLGGRRREGQDRHRRPQAEQDRHQVSGHVQLLPGLRLLGRRREEGVERRGVPVLLQRLLVPGECVGHHTEFDAGPACRRGYKRVTNGRY